MVEVPRSLTAPQQPLPTGKLGEVRQGSPPPMASPFWLGCYEVGSIEQALGWVVAFHPSGCSFCGVNMDRVCWSESVQNVCRVPQALGSPLSPPE